MKIINIRFLGILLGSVYSIIIWVSFNAGDVDKIVRNVSIIFNLFLGMVSSFIYTKYKKMFYISLLALTIISLLLIIGAIYYYCCVDFSGILKGGW
ncbi:MAG: hypothetical protein AABX00_06420 [Nanoarchaeota archaeon]